MSHSKFVALAVLVAVPLACSRDGRDTESPDERMTPASGQWPEPTTTTAPQRSNPPASPNATRGSDTSGNPSSSEADMGAAPDTIGVGAGGTTGMSPSAPNEGMAAGTSNGGTSMGGTSARGGTTGRGGAGTGGRATGGTSAGGTTGNAGSRMSP